jgi:hypothetical protein
VSGCFFWELRGFSRDFFNRVFQLPLSRNAQKRDKKNSQMIEGEKEKKRDEKKPTFFVMSPDGLFRKKVPFVFSNSPVPLVAKRPKKRVKKVDEKQKQKQKQNTVGDCFLFSAAAHVRHFRPFFFAAPLVSGVLLSCLLRI